ncbi:MAG: hypothetical protein LBQ89_00500 [Treponema sp.]|jgi:hypothetical protein|nr:hypothetical protein [Treponema sp.]
MNNKKEASKIAIGVDFAKTMSKAKKINRFHKVSGRFFRGTRGNENDHMQPEQQ